MALKAESLQVGSAIFFASILLAPIALAAESAATYGGVADAWWTTFLSRNDAVNPGLVLVLNDGATVRYNFTREGTGAIRSFSFTASNAEVTTVVGALKRYEVSCRDGVGTRTHYAVDADGLATPFARQDVTCGLDATKTTRYVQVRPGVLEPRGSLLRVSVTTEGDPLPLWRFEEEGHFDVNLTE